MSKRIITNPVDFRKNVSKKLFKILEEHEHNDKNTTYASNLEKGVYNWTLKECDTRRIIKQWENNEFVQIYIDHLRSIYINLKTKNIINLITSGKHKSYEIAFMSHQELCPEKWDEYIKAKSIRDKYKFEQNIEAMTDTFTCRSCKSNKCSFYQLQTRSADEPMTIFITCLECGNRWRS